jgi:hypothetical protein
MGVGVRAGNPVTGARGPAVRLDQAEQDAHRGGLAGAVRPRKPVTSPRADREAEVIDGGDRAEALVRFCTSTMIVSIPLW